MASFYVEWAQMYRRVSSDYRRKSASAPSMQHESYYTTEAINVAFRAREHYRVAWSIARTTGLKVRLLKGGVQ